MEIVAPHAIVIVPEVLKRNNYNRWSIFMQHYLVGQDLWDVIELSQLPAKGKMGREWIRKNALGLHAIKISCGEEMFDQIKEMNSAKDVWHKLADIHKPADQDTVKHPREKRTGPGNLVLSQYETLTNAISNGELGQVQKFLRENPNARLAGLFENGYTVLHFAVYNRTSEIVDYLIKFKLSKKDLKTKDDSGSTALSIAARFGVGKSIAQSLVRKNQNLLTIPDNDEKIPVELACSTIQEDLTRYLYRETPLQFLNVDNGAYILHECIKRKMFDIVFDLLHHFPDLASRSCPSDSISPILRLAQTQPPFFKGSNLSFWGQWIYDCIRVKAYVIKEEKHRSCVEKILDFFKTCRETIQHCFLSCEETIQVIRDGIQLQIQEIHEKNHENQQTTQEIRPTNQEIQKLSFILKLVDQFFRLLKFIIFGLPIEVLLISVFLIVLAVVIKLSVLMILVELIHDSFIVVTLCMPVTSLSRLLETNLYEIKLMDEYAREVTHLLCHKSVSDPNQCAQNEAALAEVTIQAIKNGIPEIVKEITKANANILWSSTDPEDSRPKIQNRFAWAVKHRQEGVAHVLYESAKEEKNILFATDEDGNNILHLAAKLPPHYQLGYIHAAALQLQNELRWFKSVNEIVPRSFNEEKNKDNQTPVEVFVGEHKDLLKEAGEGMKKTAESSTVVGALIITIMFALAFTVPGGNDGSTGFPILLHKTPIPFMIFMVSDATSLFAASSSVLIFLGILTSHHSDEDYHKSLLLITGLTSLFISITTMMIAFCAALFIMLQGGLGVFITVTLLAAFPIAFFVWLQFPLLFEIFVFTFGSNIFAKKETSRMSRITDMYMFAWGLRSMRT